MFVAAPLLLVGRPVVVISAALPKGWRVGLNSARVSVLPAGRGRRWWPTATAVGYTAVWWTWHVPPVYHIGVDNPLVHGLEHGSLLGAGMAFWWLVLDPRERFAGAAGVLAVFVAMIQPTVLAALLTFAGGPIYDVYQRGASLWGTTPLLDQQFAGGLMWFPGGPLYIVLGAVVFYKWLRRDERLEQGRPSGVASS